MLKETYKRKISKIPRTNQKAKIETIEVTPGSFSRFSPPLTLDEKVKHGEITWDTCIARYREEMNLPSIQKDLLDIAKRAVKEDIYIVCNDKAENQKCYRFILMDIISEIANAYNIPLDVEKTEKGISKSRHEPRKFTLQTDDKILKDITEPNAKEVQEMAQIKTEDGSVRELKRRSATLKGINSKIAEKKAIEKDEQSITYLSNKEAQEEANELHSKTLEELKTFFQNHGFLPKESVVDLLVESKNKVFVFEIKSVHKANFKDQTRYAIGQLLEYEYFEVKNKSNFKNLEIHKGVVYSEEPPKEFRLFLEAYNIGVY